jgi:hypothetical protein
MRALPGPAAVHLNSVAGVRRRFAGGGAKTVGGARTEKKRKARRLDALAPRRTWWPWAVLGTCCRAQALASATTRRASEIEAEVLDCLSQRRPCLRGFAKKWPK